MEPDNIVRLDVAVCKRRDVATVLALLRVEVERDVFLGQVETNCLGEVALEDVLGACKSEPVAERLLDVAFWRTKEVGYVEPHDASRVGAKAEGGLTGRVGGSSCPSLLPVAKVGHGRGFDVVSQDEVDLERAFDDRVLHL